jgi:hypothetical protein
MSEAKKIETADGPGPLPRLVGAPDGLPPISVHDQRDGGPEFLIDSTGRPVSSHHASGTPASFAPPVTSGQPRPLNRDGSKLLTRVLLVLGCIFVCFGLGVAVAAAVLSGSIDLKGLAWVKDLLRSLTGK